MTLIVPGIQKNKLYRRKAQELHPDKGGDHDQFVRLTEAYHELVKTKK